MIRFASTLILVVCLCHRMALAQMYGFDSLSEDAPDPVTLFPQSYTQFDRIRNDFSQTTKRTISLDLGPKLVELKALYLEKQQDGGAPTSATSAGVGNWGNYFDLLATSSGFGGKLVGEGELAYSTLGISTMPDQRPLMSRLALRGNWGKTGYGFLYRSFGSGFISMTGTQVDHARDEGQLWGEYDFGLFRLRGTVGESREKNSDTNDLILTRTAATSFQLDKPSWSALLSSSYSLTGQGEEAGPQTLAFTNAFSIAYRPTGFLTIEPGLSFKEEWDPTTGLKADTPSAGVALVFTPYRDLQLTSRASYARGISDDPFKEVETLNTAAALNWKIGKSFLGDQFLSVQVEYKNELHPSSSNSPQPNLTGMIQWKMVRF